MLLEDSLPLKKCIFLYLYLEIETDTDGVTKCKLFIAVCLPLESDYIVYLSPLVILPSVFYNRLSFWCLRILCHLQYSASWHCHRGECAGLANRAHPAAGLTMMGQLQGAAGHSQLEVTSSGKGTDTGVE